MNFEIHPDYKSENFFDRLAIYSAFIPFAGVFLFALFGVFSYIECILSERGKYDFTKGMTIWIMNIIVSFSCIWGYYKYQIYKGEYSYEQAENTPDPIPATPKQGNGTPVPPTVAPTPILTPPVIGNPQDYKKPSATAKVKMIEIFKSKRLLKATYDDDGVFFCKINLGFEPVGDKEAEGDGRTPEGLFYICLKNSQSRYTLSLGVSYPNLEDAQRGLDKKLISQKKYNDIKYAIGRKKTPPWNTKLGGEIFIHGKGKEIDGLNDWTAGCIAITDENIKKLFKKTALGIPVIIYH